MEETQKYMQFEGTTQDFATEDIGGQFSLKTNPIAQAPSTLLCPSDPSNNYKPGLMDWSSTHELGVASYASNIQSLGHYYEKQPTPNLKRKIPTHFPFGTSKTVVFAERYQICPTDSSGRNAWLGTLAHTNGVISYNPFFAANNNLSSDPGYPWGLNTIALPQDAPSQSQCNPLTVQSAHPGTMNILMVDGSVQRISSGAIEQLEWIRMTVPELWMLINTQEEAQ
jgi:prepilin-type processing-associated H-X9-DG protein